MGGSMKETEVTKKKPAKAKAQPVAATTASNKGSAQPAKSREPEDQVLFLRGRHARGAGIRREDSPYLGHERDVWLEGYDYEEGA
jgi:hypothetical protein